MKRFPIPFQGSLSTTCLHFSSMVLMKRVYLDWGVISNLKKPEYDRLRQFLISHKGELLFALCCV